jgi:hypothetical protein
LTSSLDSDTIGIRRTRMIKIRKRTEALCLLCGKTLSVREDQVLSTGNLCRSCGSLTKWKRKEYREKCSEAHKGKLPGNRLPEGEASLNALIHSYRKSAEKRGIQFDLTRDEVKIITKKNCFYCGREPNQSVSQCNHKSLNGDWIHNGIDRKSDEAGYILENVVPCCKICNYAKQGLTVSEFLALCKSIVDKHYECDTAGSRQITTK